MFASLRISFGLAQLHTLAWKINGPPAPLLVKDQTPDFNRLPPGSILRRLWIHESSVRRSDGDAIVATAP